MEDGLLRNVATLGHHARIAGPANLDAAEEVSLGACHAEDPARIELRMIAEDLRIGMEAHARPPPIVDFAQLFEPALRHAAREGLAIELAIARHLDLEQVRECIDDGDADAVQTA